jgi:hypothetical protein
LASFPPAGWSFSHAGIVRNAIRNTPLAV